MVLSVPLLPLAVSALATTQTPVTSQDSVPPARSVLGGPRGRAVVPVATPPDVPRSAPTPATPQVSPAPKITSDMVQRMVDRVLKETSAIRHLAVKHPVKSGVRSRAEVEKMFQDDDAEGAPEPGKPGATKQEATKSGAPRQTGAEKADERDADAEEPDSMEVYFRQLGMAPDDYNIEKSVTSVMGEQIAGSYDPDTKTFYTSDSVTPTELEEVMAHELTHALQDQWFDLKRLDDLPDNESDAEMAVKALEEGDATFTELQYMQHNAQRLKQFKANEDSAEDSDSPEFDNSPSYLQGYLTFPYLKGLDFVTQLYKRGGWAQISQAYKRVPQSSEQILHFDKYLAHEAPIPVKLRDVTPQLGAGWTLLDDDVNGEMGLALVLDEYIKNRAAVDKAAAGWGGDRYAVYYGPRKAAVVVQDTTWDSLRDANEWRDAYALRTTTRFKSKPQSQGALQTWKAASRGVWLEQRGRRVVIVEGKVGAFDATKVLNALFVA